MASLRGTVRWRGTRTPIPDAEIWLMQRKIARHKTQTDKGGRYAFIRVKAGEGCTIRATAAGAGSTATAPFALAEGDGKRQDIELERNDVSTQTTATSATTSSTTDTRTNMTSTATVAGFAPF